MGKRQCVFSMWIPRTVATLDAILNCTVSMLEMLSTNHHSMICSDVHEAVFFENEARHEVEISRPKQGVDLGLL